jgi:hypothetical protein
MPIDQPGSFRLVRVSPTEHGAASLPVPECLIFDIGHQVEEVRQRRGRPLSAAPILGLDAAWFAVELERRGLSAREAAEAVRQLLGTARSVIDKYKDEARRAVSAADASRLASGIVFKWWRTIEPRLPTLHPRARQAVSDLFLGRTTAALPPPKRRKRRP